MAERLFRAIGRPDMIDDPRFRTNTDRVRNIDACDGIVAAWIAERTLVENMAVFEAAEVTATPIYEIDQLLDDPHVQARGVLVEVPDDEAGSVLMHNVIPRLSRHTRQAPDARPDAWPAHQISASINRLRR